MEAPPTIRYVSIDFERETLTARLDAGGLDSKAKAFFSWLGVTQYLTRDAVLNSLREIVSATVAGSEIVATFVVATSILQIEPRASFTRPFQSGQRVSASRGLVC